MTSRVEAEFYIKHGPGMRMDGDHADIPCANDSRLQTPARSAKAGGGHAFRIRTCGLFIMSQQLESFDGGDDDELPRSGLPLVLREVRTQ
jgi:hypothetical protein